MDEAPNSQAAGTAPTAELPAARGFSVHISPSGSPGLWADIVPKPDGRTDVVLGCCTDPSAGGRLRSHLREVLRGGAVAALGPDGGPDGADGESVSAVYAVIDATTLAYRTYGDAATVVIVPDGTTRRRDGHLLLCDLAPGATVLLSTAPIPAAAALLGGGAALHPEELADRIFAGGADSPHAAVLYRHPPEPMSITLPAEPSNLAASRGRLRTWLSEAGVDPESAADVLLAVGEAAANATEHAVIGTDHEVSMTVSAALSGNILMLTVSDNGRWKPAAESPGHRGHGLHLINALVDSVELTATPGGTTVAMLKELP